MLGRSRFFAQSFTLFQRRLSSAFLQNSVSPSNNQTTTKIDSHRGHLYWENYPHIPLPKSELDDKIFRAKIENRVEIFDHDPFEKKRILTPEENAKLDKYLDEGERSREIFSKY